MTMSLTRRSVLTLGGAVIVSGGALQAVQASADLSLLTASQVQVLSKINAAFDAIRTMSGRFQQEAPDGNITGGSFLMSRPGKMQFKYDLPVEMEIRCDGRTVAIDDKLRKTQTFAFLSDTPLAYLLADRVDLIAANVVKAVHMSPTLVTVAMQQDGMFTQGKIKLVFDAKTIELKQWIATDAQGYDTIVSLSDTRVGVAVDDAAFVIDSHKYDQHR